MPDFHIINDPIPSGLSVIESSAGTGKTYTLSRLVPRLILDPDSGITELSQILLVTFTNDAARELSDRVRKALEKLLAPPERDEAVKDPAIHELRTAHTKTLGAEGLRARISAALLDIDRLNVSTIHSFCQRTLQTEGALCGLPVMPELVTGTDELIEDSLHGLWEKEIGSSETAASLATADKWKFAEDLRFHKTFLSHHRADPVPPAVDFHTALRSLDGLAASYTPAVCDELQPLLKAVKDWSAKAPPSPKECFEFLVATLRNSQNTQDPGFLGSVREIARVPDWINGSLKKEVAACDAVRIAAEAVNLFATLRWHFRISCLGKIHAEVDRTLRKNRQISYDGLIVRLSEALKGANGPQLVERLRERYRIALIDESQDTDPRQFGIFERIFLANTSHSLVLIGDPKQAIYGFRGADVNTYLQAKLRPGTRVHGLTRTFRAPAKLVRSTNALFRRPGSLLKENLLFEPATSGIRGDRRLLVGGEKSGARLEFWNAPDGNNDYSNNPARLARIAGEVASEIVRVLATGTLVSLDEAGHPIGNPEPVHPGHIAVLVSAGYQAQEIEKALKARNVPAVRAGGDDVMASEEATDLLAILKALDDPRKKSLRFAALATRMLGLTDEDLRALDASEEAMLPDFLRWEEVLLKKGAAVALSLIDSEKGIVRRLATGDDGDRRVTNFRQLSDILQAAYAEHGSHPEKLLRWFSGEVARATDRSDVEERQLQLESDDDAVRIVTMHKSKGLEYPLVFCPFLWDSSDPRDQEKLSQQGAPDQLVDTKLASTIVKNGQSEEERYKNALERRLCELQPGLKAAARVKLLQKSACSSAEAALSRASLEERIRLAYVAITRAQVKVWIHSGELRGSSNGFAASALDWLLRTQHLAEENHPLDEFDFEIWRLKAADKDRGSRHQDGIDLLLADPDLQDLIIAKTPPAPNDNPWNRNQDNDPADLHPLPAPDNIPEPWYLTSFSSLTKEKDPHWEPENPQQSEPTPPLSDTPSSSNENPFRNAAGGKTVGTVIHDWIEGWNFGPLDAEAFGMHLEGYTLPEPKDGEPLFRDSALGMLDQLRGSILPGFEIPIQKACPEPKSSEWHFHIPILRDRPLSTLSLARIFERHPQEGYDDYHQRLEDLDTGDLGGFLHGFIDRLAVLPEKGQWGVVDWKTNRLPSYDLASLRKCAVESHYFLQCHLYLVALGRYLGGLDKVSGAWLVFLRGISSGTTDGNLRIDPPRQLLEELDTLFFKP